MMRQHRTVYAYADALSDYVESLQELYDLPTSGMFTDLLGYAVSCVDWDEIAENFADGYFDD
jgi:predicted amidophosphoribosyltransferase